MGSLATRTTLSFAEASPSTTVTWNTPAATKAFGERLRAFPRTRRSAIQHACFAGSQHAPAAPPLVSTALRALSASQRYREAEMLTSEGLEKARSVLTSPRQGAC